MKYPDMIFNVFIQKVLILKNFTISQKQRHKYWFYKVLIFKKMIYKIYWYF